MARPVCQAAVDLIKSFEQCRLEAYLPTTQDRWTVGWGETGPDITQGTIWTQEQADERFAARLAAFAQGVEEAVTAQIGDNQFGACVSLAYNIGVPAFRGSTLLRMMNALDLASAADQFLRWNKQRGIALAGLTRRREAERTLFLTPDAAP